jgi:hypothetical protein
MIRVARLFMKTPAQGAAAPIYLASSPEVEGITGQYFVNRKPRSPATPPTTPQPPPGYGRPASTWRA